MRSQISRASKAASPFLTTGKAFDECHLNSRERSMMGRGEGGQGQFFYAFDLDKVVPPDHLVRQIDSVIDLSWVHQELAPYYSDTGRPSIDPVLMIQMGTVAAVKADPVVAIAMFIKGEGGFRDRELYPFCFRIADGKTLASPKAVPAGTDVRSLKDSKGNAYGEAIYAAAQKPEGQITEVPSYMFPKPDTTTPTFEKVSFVTKVGDLGCGVGYYK